MVKRGEVARRRVFYIPGYDPMPARRYREIYRREGAEQAQISGYTLGLAPRVEDTGYGWEVRAEIEGTQVETSVEVLVWDDIVRGSMDHGITATYRQLAHTAWAYGASGAFRRLLMLRKGPVLAALYPAAMLLGQALAAALAGWALMALAAVWLPCPVATILGVILFVRLMVWFHAQDHRLYAYYLMHDYAFTARTGGAWPPALEDRMEDFRMTVAAALADPELDEVLVVGHSSGAAIAISILADLLRRGEAGRMPVLSLLTLGHCVPMASFLPRAWRLRDDLHYLSTRQELVWIDVSAPGDGASFALCDPVSVSGVAPKEGKVWPLVLSAAFRQTLSRRRWRRLRWKFFRLHFQYIHAFDKPGDYDYFKITAGPQTLGARFARREPSGQRIERPLSPYRSRAA